MLSEKRTDIGQAPASLASVRGTCFGPGTLISTTEGDLPVEWLVVGDRVLTRDRGAQPIEALSRLSLPGAQLADMPDLRPVNYTPDDAYDRRDLHSVTLAAKNRVLVKDCATELLFGMPQALATVGDLSLNQAKPRGDSVHYVSIALVASGLVRANGIWCEANASSSHAPPAYPVLRTWEAKLLMTRRGRGKIPSQILRAA
ncbi:MAG: Hint domain-containing protein [Pseudomonadota bacterium]